MNYQQFYSGQDITRAAELRKKGRTGNNLKRKVIVIWDDRVFFDAERDFPIFLDFSTLPFFLQVSQEFYFLGLCDNDGEEISCLDVSGLNLDEAKVLLGKGEFMPVREIVGQIDRKQAAYVGYAKGIARWNRKNAFCGVCGSAMDKREKGHVRKCRSVSCGETSYPRIDPAVIVLIEHKPKGFPPVCLLNRRKTDFGYSCSPFAGFVEIGESLEDTVRREMKEEVNVNVENIRYAASQPWPFPSSLMIGMVAETRTTEFMVDNIEIVDAQWYTAAEIQKEVNDQTMVLSKGDSIARYLIETWVNSNYTIHK